MSTARPGRPSSSIPTLAPIAALLALGLMLGPTAAADEPRGPLDVEPDEVRPGLIAAYRSLDAGGAALHRIDPKPAFTLGHSSPHPRIPPGPFEATWDGLLHLQDPGPIAFHAFLGGELTVEVDGVTVLRGTGMSGASRLGPADTLMRPPGHYRMTIRYRSLAEVPARLKILWEGPTFAREPLPAWRLVHLAAARAPELAEEERAARGRDAAGRLGCARCHSGTFPGVTDLPPGPSLADAGRRLRREWIVRWLDDPARVRPGARMPGLFPADRRGFVERWVLADFLAPDRGDRRLDRPSGDHRAGRLAFLGLGCAACHLVPDLDRGGHEDSGRTALDGLRDRFGADDLAAFLGNPHARYPDGRMPRLPVAPKAARDIAAYLLLWSGPSPDPAATPAPTAEEIRAEARRLGVSGRDRLATALLVEKGCNSCHPGLGPTSPRDVGIREEGRRGCLSTDGMPHFTLEGPTREALSAYLKIAAQETHPSPFAARQLRLERAGCIRCHRRDGDRPPPIEEIGQTLGGAFLQALPYQRTPRLTDAHQKFTHRYLLTAVREGVSGLRGPDYTYRMPAFGPDAEALVQALAEADGDLGNGDDPPARLAADPTLGTLSGPDLVGSRGYGCISCHVWDGQQLAPSDPGAVGPDLTRLVGRVRRDWFDRFLEDPARSYPGTPMPAIFPRGQKASLTAILDGDPAKQREALWAYFARGRDAPAPKPPPPVPIEAPAPDAPPLVAQIPIRPLDGAAIEALCLLNDQHDLLIYDLAAGAPHGLFTGAQILRNVQGRTRQFLAAGEPVGLGLAAGPALQLVVGGKPEAPEARALHGYDRLIDGARIRGQAQFAAGSVEVEETLRIVRDDGGGHLERTLRLTGIPAGASAVVRGRSATGRDVTTVLTPDARGIAEALRPRRTAAREVRPRLGGQAVGQPRPRRGFFGATRLPRGRLPAPEVRRGRGSDHARGAGGAPA
jgi:cytochrome c2